MSRKASVGGVFPDGACVVLTLLCWTLARAGSLAQPVTIPDPGLEAAFRDALHQPSGPLTEEGLQTLTYLNASRRGISNLEGLNHASHLEQLDLSENLLTDLNFPAGLTELFLLSLNGNGLTELILPADLGRLGVLNLNENYLTSTAFLGGLSNLVSLELEYNELETLEALPRPEILSHLNLAYNRMTNLSCLAPMTALQDLYLDDNGLTHFSLPPEMTNLTALSLSLNRLTDFSFLSQLPALSFLDLSVGRIAHIALPANLSALSWANLAQNRLTELTLPPGLDRLTYLFVHENPLQTFVLPEDLATNNLADLVVTLKNQGVTVYTYPVSARLGPGRWAAAGAFAFDLTGPPGAYAVLVSTNLVRWSPLAALTNRTGSASFTDTTAAGIRQRFYRVGQPLL